MATDWQKLEAQIQAVGRRPHSPVDVARSLAIPGASRPEPDNDDNSDTASSASSRSRSNSEEVLVRPSPSPPSPDSPHSAGPVGALLAPSNRRPQQRRALNDSWTDLEGSSDDDDMQIRLSPRTPTPKCSAHRTVCDAPAPTQAIAQAANPLCNRRTVPPSDGTHETHPTQNKRSAGPMRHSGSAVGRESLSSRDRDPDGPATVPQVPAIAVGVPSRECAPVANETQCESSSATAAETSVTLLEASASFQPLDKSLCASVAEDRPSAADRVQAAEAELRVIYQKHAQLEATVRALETQWHERQKKQQERIERYRVREQQLLQQLERTAAELKRQGQEKRQAFSTAHAWQMLQTAMEEKCSLLQRQTLFGKENQLTFQAELLQRQTRALGELQERHRVSQALQADAEAADRAAQALYEARVADLQQQNEALQARLDQSEEEGTSTQQRWSQQVDSLHAHTRRLENMLTDKQEVLVKMQSELLDTQQQLQALRDSADATAQQEHDTSTASAAGAPDAQHEALRGELAALRAMLMERAGRPPVTSSAGAQTDLQGSVVGDELHRSRLHDNEQLMEQNRVLSEESAKVVQKNAHLLEQLQCLRSRLEEEASTDVRKELEDLRAEHARVVSALAEVTTENDTLKARHEELTEALQSRMREVQRLQILNNCNGRRALRAARETVGDLRLNGSPALNPLQPDRTRTGLRHPV
uniref:Uncharacterized protein n=1 Tax=Eutreptiella gymnastica TaxID=73025 RepID=A0A7S4D024_9EUGL